MSVCEFVCKKILPLQLLLVSKYSSSGTTYWPHPLIFVAMLLKEMLRNRNLVEAFSFISSYGSEYMFWYRMKEHIMILKSFICKDYITRWILLNNFWNRGLYIGRLFTWELHMWSQIKQGRKDTRYMHELYNIHLVLSCLMISIFVDIWILLNNFEINKFLYKEGD